MLAALMENKECQLVPEDLASKALGAKEERKKKKKGTGFNTGQQSAKQQQERRHSAP